MTLKQYARRGSRALIALVFGAIALSGIAIREISFGGPLFTQNQLQSDLIADILPPPEYIIEPFLEATTMVEDKQVAGHVESFASLRKAYEERKAYWRTAGIPGALNEQLEVSHKSADAFWQSADELINAAQGGDWVTAKQIHDTRLTPEFSAHKAEILKLVALAETEQKRLKEHSAMLLYLSVGGLLVSAGAIIAALLTGAKFLNRRVIAPVDATAEEMRQMAAGNFNIAISGAGRTDEIGQMAEAMHIFRETGIAKAEADAKQQRVVTELGEGLEQLAAGNMTHRIEKPFAAEYEALRTSFNRTVADLGDILSRVTESATHVDTGATQIRSAADDLSQRTEQQAASLEETSAAMSTVTAMAQETAKARNGVRQAIDEAHREAHEGGEVVRDAVKAMSEIEASAQQISQIITVIDGIAFQTNLLALNAGVEAARAGDAGKGFAVVANEVRALAQRSADAARDIKDLITTSGQHVAAGVGLVGQTGEMLGRIVTKVGEVSDLITSMAGATETQARNMAQVNETVSDMDTMTQQNAAMVEETTAAARSLASEAQGLRQLVTRFQLSGQAPYREAAPAKPARAKTRTAPASVGNLALAAEADDWSDF
ncbi:MAG: methyl-accepting chemotaxis protein [Sphingobium sp.]|jgi:methyl-accepting chemotaxis protein|nr:methyl-accepting chemotaxis protein [Sphingobium sp.]MCI1271426.1 methyl-accepting chemotaxis protein [Sphingobium sp.]MCI1755643.1 methyl-accepting chemotaxis protein [Sphingobium sp.]MCI2052539.1 methyl-accepting chemotaxis protein [Sphingobium sp.]